MPPGMLGADSVQHRGHVLWYPSRESAAQNQAAATFILMEEQVDFQPSLFASLQEGDACVSEHPEREGKLVETAGAITVTTAGISSHLCVGHSR